MNKIEANSMYTSFKYQILQADVIKYAHAHCSSTGSVLTRKRNV